MVNATVDNEAISITLAGGESTTVPSGEVWKVTISVGTNFVQTLRINGKDNSYGDSASGNAVIEGIVLTGGDTLMSDGNSDGATHIGGFVVN